MDGFWIGLGLGLGVGCLGCLVLWVAALDAIEDERRVHAYERQAMADALVEAGKGDAEPVERIPWEQVPGGRP